MNMGSKNAVAPGSGAGAPQLLSDAENKTLLDCESVIQRGLTDFMEVGTALLTISEQKLYRATHRSFDEYVRNRWGMGKSRAYQLRRAASVIREISDEASTIVDTPVNSAQAVALADAPAGRRAALLQKVAASGRVTAKAIKDEIEGNRRSDTEPEFHPRLRTKFQLRGWWKNASPVDRGKFVSDLFHTAAPVKANKLDLTERFENWMKEFVTEVAINGKPASESPESPGRGKAKLPRS